MLPTSSLATWQSGNVTNEIAGWVAAAEHKGKKQHPQPNHHLRHPEPWPLGSYQHPPTRVRCTVTNTPNPKCTVSAALSSRWLWEMQDAVECRAGQWPGELWLGPRIRSLCRACVPIQSSGEVCPVCPPGCYLDISTPRPS